MKSFTDWCEACWDGYTQKGMKKKGDRMVPNCVPEENTIDEARVDKHEMAGYVVIDGYVFKDSGKQGRSTYGRYTTKDPNYVKDPKEVGMHRNYRKPDYLSFSTMAELKKWLKTQPKKSAADIEAVHKKYADYEKMYGEATYQGRKVPLNKPMAGDVKKSKVFVDPDGDGIAKKVNFGDKNMTIKKNIPARRKSFRARHNCDNPGPKDKARYWSCKAW